MTRQETPFATHGELIVHRGLPGTSRALIVAPPTFQPSASDQLRGRNTISGSYVARIGHISALSCSSAQSGNKIPVEKGSTSAEI